MNESSDDAVTRLYLVRHGQVHNPDALAYGHLPRFRISALGRAQAEATAGWLGARAITALFTSPLLRARQTATIIRGRIGDVSLHTARDLRESELARFWQGVPWLEVARLHPELYETFERAPSRITTGETINAQAARVAGVCRRAARRYPGAALALISHRDPILSLRLTLEGRPDDLNRTDCRQGSVTEFTWDGRALRFQRYVEPDAVLD